jgi:hypothetical protein
MTKAQKLYEQLVRSPRSVRFREFQRVLTCFGFALDRVRGSHHIYQHRLVARPLSVQPVGNMAKPYQIEQFLDIVEEFGLMIEE